jgi:hypothetical protein
LADSISGFLIAQPTVFSGDVNVTGIEWIEWRARGDTHPKILLDVGNCVSGMWLLCGTSPQML